MKCTCCHQGELQPQLLEGLFQADVCNHCGGVWIVVENFVAWKQENPDQVLLSDLRVEEVEAIDTKRAILCPVTGSFMYKLKISADVSHRIDYSVKAGGIWLDKGEWELIKASGLADILNTLVTKYWQNRIGDAQAQQNFTQIYIDKFGADTYQRMQEIRQWLSEQKNAAEIKDYLNAEDPYSAKR